MRITNLMMTNNAIRHIQENQERINVTEEQISTGKLFQNPSEDPINASHSMQLRSSLRVSAGYRNTAEMMSDWMSTTDKSLSQLVALANRANKIVISGLNDTVGSSERKNSLAIELTEMINQAVDLGNTKFQGNYIFSGTSVDTAAFDLSDPSTLMYNGKSKSMYRNIGQDSKIVLNVNGDEAIAPLIDAMIEARDNLAANDMTDLPSTLDKLNGALDALVASQTQNGTRMKQVETSIASLEKMEISIKALLSKKEDTSMSEAIAMLNSQEITYQAVLEVGSRTISALNLFDYLN